MVRQCMDKAYSAQPGANRKQPTATPLCECDGNLARVDNCRGARMREGGGQSLTITTDLRTLDLEGGTQHRQRQIPTYKYSTSLQCAQKLTRVNH